MSDNININVPAPEIGPYTQLKPFRFWCQKVLPLVYDESLSYYELLCKVVDYLNKTMEDVDQMITDMGEYRDAYIAFSRQVTQTVDNMQLFIDNYFNNLDVQEEINNKLDAMAEAGYFDTLFTTLFTADIITEAGNVTSAWITENLLQETGYVIDNSLTIANAAADAKATGMAINEIETNFNLAFNVVKSPNIFNNVFPQSGSINADGTEYDAAANYMRTDYLSVPENSESFRIVRSESPYRTYIMWYDASKVPIDERITVFASNATVKINTLSVPENAAFYRLVVPNEAFTQPFTGILAVYPNSDIATAIPYGEPLSVQPKFENLYNKKIVFMGDSIIGNESGPSGICQLIQKKTGADVINAAFGGTRMAYEYSTHGDATPGATGYNEGTTPAQQNQVDQYRYWNTISGVGLSSAIKTGNWTAQINAVEEMSGALNYFVSRMQEISSIDWSTVDFILWEYGTNDFSTRVMLDDTTNPDNLFAFVPAYKKAIENILSEYPNIQIIPITPTWRCWLTDDVYVDDSNTHTIDDYTGNARLLTAFVVKVEEIARSYQLPNINNYYNLGFNKFNHSRFLADGTHPNENGRVAIAERVTSQLNSIL